MENGVMIQYFEWNVSSDGMHWKRLEEDANYLKNLGISSVWIPPAYKGTSAYDVGYGAYDLYDLGEFDQKGTIRTKYGTKDELKKAIDALHAHHIDVYLDVVLNHKGGADHTEVFYAEEVASDNRSYVLSEPKEIEGWTSFTFPGRNGKYSSFTWNYTHFNGTDYDQRTGKNAIYRICGEHKRWDEGVDNEFGNYDYLMFANIDYNHPDVRNEIISWGKWIVQELQLDGMRLDAVKHISDEFISVFLNELRKVYGASFYSVGEYWKNSLPALEKYLEELSYGTDIFDVGLHYNFHRASREGAGYDLRQLFDQTVQSHHSLEAVTFVDNHDSQAGSALSSEVSDWFKPQAYACILLQKEGYPCVFYGDLYGIGGNPSIHRYIIEQLLYIRKSFAYGEQHLYFDHPNTVGFTRSGIDHSTGCAVLLSNGTDGYKDMYIGQEHRGQYFYEATGRNLPDVQIRDDGYGTFRVDGGTCAVYVPKDIS